MVNRIKRKVFLISKRKGINNYRREDEALDKLSGNLLGIRLKLDPSVTHLRRNLRLFI